MAEDEGGDVDDGRHLCRLAELDALDSISIVAADFYGHLAFRQVVTEFQDLNLINVLTPFGDSGS